ncbi:MAG: Glucose-6-P dehydrogenase subunit-like protein [Chthoniobacteraceae bacterium]|nr:Glucose-6-P dehydrogenase subunit-like protein [Chthoniobacteraceae bacterium]
MPVTIDPTALGMPVELGQISRELKKLWEQDGGVSTRASLINLAVYCEGVESMRANTELIMEFTHEHACRAILIGYEPGSENQIHAWINAHCHLSRAGAKQVCCEQISFLFEGDTKKRIANILFSNLDSDLPLYLLWRGEFPDPVDEQLWAWVDRLIFDSQSWRDPKSQFALLKDSLVRSKSRLTLCDLNWTRSLHLRQALAQMFDHAENLSVLDNLKTVAIAHAPNFRSTALLLVGWFAAQLKLVFVKNEGGALVYLNPHGNEVRFSLTAEEGRSISRCELTSDTGSIRLQRDGAGDFFRVEVRLTDNRVYNHLLPAGINATAALILEEIGGGGQHKVYLNALAASEVLL